MSHVGDRCRLRDPDAENAAGGAGGARTDADENAGRTGPHQVQAGVVGGTAADDRGNLEGRDELLQVERLGDRGDVLAGDDGALDDQDVEAGLERELVVLEDPLRGQGSGDDDFLLLDFPDPLGDQLRLDGLLVDLLHLARRQILGQVGDPLELLVGVLVAREDALEVQDGQTAQLPDDPCGLGRDDAVHRRGEHRQLELVGPELPGDVDVIRVARPPGRNNRDVVETISPTTLLSTSDLYLHRGILAVGTDEKTPLSAGPDAARHSGVIAFSAMAAKGS